MKNAANFKKLQRFFDHIIMYIGESADAMDLSCTDIPMVTYNKTV